MDRFGPDDGSSDLDNDLDFDRDQDDFVSLEDWDEEDVAEEERFEEAWDERRNRASRQELRFETDETYRGDPEPTNSDDDD